MKNKKRKISADNLQNQQVDLLGTHLATLNPRRNHSIELLAIASKLHALSILLAGQVSESKDISDLFVGLSNIHQQLRRSLEVAAHGLGEFMWVPKSKVEIRSKKSNGKHK